MTQPEMPSPPARGPQGPLRWLLFLLLLAGLALLLLALPPEYQTPALLAVSLAALLLYRLPQTGPNLVLYAGLLREQWSRPGVRAVLPATLALLLAGLWIGPGAAADLTGPLLLFGAGLLLLAVADWRSRRETLLARLERLRDRLAAGPPPQPRPHPSAPPLRSVQPRPVGAGLVCLLLLMQINVLEPDQSLLQVVALLPHLQMALLLAGSGLVAAGLCGGLPAPPEVAAWARARWRRPAWRWLLLILGGALALRLWNLDGWTHRLLDEIHYMDAVVRLRGDRAQLLLPFNQVTAFTWVYPYWQGVITDLLSPSLGALRLLSALFGVAQVAAVYALGRALFNRRTALLAAVIMAALPVHWHFSRIGINNIADPVMGTLALACLVRGLRHGRAVDFVLAGLCLGWTQYFYEGGRLFFVPFALCWLLWLAWFGRPAGWQRPTRRNLLLLLSMAGALTVPLLYVYFGQSLTLIPRLTEMGSAAPAAGLLERLGRQGDMLLLVLRALIQLPDASWFYGGPTGYVIPALLPWFMVGLAVCLGRLRQPAGSLLLWWIVGSAAGLSLLASPLEAPRYLGLLPALALIVAAGVIQPLDWLLPGAAHDLRLRRLRNAVILLAAAGFTLAQVAYYTQQVLPRFDRHVMQFEIDYAGSGAVYPDTDDVLLRALALPPNTRVYIVSRKIVWDYNGEALTRYFGRPDLSIQHIFKEDLTDRLLRNLPAGMLYAFFVEADDQDTPARLQALFTLSEEPLYRGGFSPRNLPPGREMALFLMIPDVNSFQPERELPFVPQPLALGALALVVLVWGIMGLYRWLPARIPAWQRLVTAAAQTVLPPAPARLPRRQVAAELALVLAVTLVATRVMLTAPLHERLPGGEMEWLTGHLTLAHVTLRDTGDIPLWNPYYRTGEPLIDNAFSPLVNPLVSVPALLWGPPLGYRYAVVLHMALVALGGWYLARVLGLGAVGRVLLALLLLGKGNQHAMLLTGYFQLGLQQSYFPWIIAGAVQTMRGRRPGVLLTGLMMGLMFLVGNVWYILPMLLSVAAVALAYTRYEGRLNWRGWRGMLLAAALMLSFSAVYTLPVVTQYDHIGDHADEVDGGWMVLDRWQGMTLYFNERFEAATSELDVFMPRSNGYTLGSPYFYYSFVVPGWLVVAVFIVVPPLYPLLHRPARRDHRRVWLAGLALVALMTVWGLGGSLLFGWLYNTIPLLGGWRFVGRALAVGSFWVAVLVTLRVDALWRSTQALPAAWLRGLAGAALVLACAAAVRQTLTPWLNSGLQAEETYVDTCLRGLRAARPDEHLSVWMFGYVRLDPFLEQRIRLYNIEAEFLPLPEPFTVGSRDWLLWREMPPYALPDANNRAFLREMGYMPLADSPRVDGQNCLLYWPQQDIPYAFTLPPDRVAVAQPWPLLQGDSVPVRPALRRADTVVLPVAGAADERLLIVQETAYPGWQVTLNGQPAALEVAGGLVAVRLPPGPGQFYEVVFAYRPPLVMIGGALTLTTCALCLVVLLRRRLRRR
ncbi:MAG: glycosyltransferase family 39 protein [Anaerolineae bacterium]|nr:glycosyltransferase family 39 protein [Anaerolineae bacterium]